MKKVISTLLNILFFSFSILTASEPLSENKIFYLNNSDCNQDYFFSCIQAINTSWEFYWDKTPEQVYEIADSGQLPDANIKVPSNWNKVASQITGKKEDLGKATYRIMLKNLNPNSHYGILINEGPASSAAIYVNRKLISVCGDPFGNNDGNYHSIIKPIYTDFISNSEGTAELLIFINNYFYRIGGLWTPVQIGPNDDVFRYYNFLSALYLICLGIIVFIFILTLIQFCLNPKQKQYFYLCVITFACITRVAVAGFNTLNLFIPNLPAEIKTKIELIAIWIIPIFYYLLLLNLYPAKEDTKIFKVIPLKIFRYIYLTINSLLGIGSIFLIPYLSTKMVPYLQIVGYTGALFVIATIVINMVRKKEYIYYHLFGIFNLLGGFVFDMIFETNKEVLKISYMPIFFAMYSVILICMLGKIQNNTYKKIEEVTNDLQNTNLSYIRFVPLEFLSLLKKDSITNIQQGDHSSVEMSIIFSKISIFDVRNSCIPDANIQYEIFCDYLKKISPYITRHNGFISKFLSGGIIALFPGLDTADDALYASLKMVECLKQLNKKFESEGIKINVFTGVHYGKMILGTIGDKNRLDDTVISDTVNSVSRIESVCERLNKNVIVSEELFNRTAPATIDIVNISELQPIQIKGKTKTLKLIACESKLEVYEQPVNNIQIAEEDFEVLEEID